MSVRALNGGFLFVAALMIATALRSTPHVTDWLALATPLIALWSFWGSVQSLNKSTSSLKTRVTVDDEPAFLRLRQRIEFVVLMGLFAIMTAIFAGWWIGRTATRWVH